MYHSDCPSLTFHHRHRHIRPSFSLPSSHSMEQMDRMRRLTSPGVRAASHVQKKKQDSHGPIQHKHIRTQTSIHTVQHTTNCGNIATSQLQSQSQPRTTLPTTHPPPPDPNDLTHSDIIYTDHDDDDDEMRSSSTASVLSSTSELSQSSTSLHDDDLHHISPPPLSLSPRSSFDAHVIPNFESLIGESVEKHYFHGTMKKRCYQIGTDSSWYEMDTPLVSPSPSSLVHPHHDVTLTDAYALLLRLSTLTDTHTVTPAHPSHLSGHYLIDWLVEHCFTSPWLLTSRYHAHDVCQAMMYMGWIQSIQTCYHHQDESIHLFHDTNILYQIVIPSYVILNDIIKTSSDGTIIHVPIPTPIAPRPKRASSCTLPRGSSLTITRSPSESPTPHDTLSGQAITLSISCITNAITCWTLHNFTSLESLIIQLRTIVLDEMDMYESITFWLNIYHTLMLHALHMSTLPTTTIQRIIMYQTYQYVIAGEVYSLLDIEYGILRACMTQETMRPRDRFIPYPPRFSSTDRRHRHTHHMWKDPRITFLMCDGTSESPTLHIITPTTLPTLLITATQRYLIQSIHLRYETRTSSISTCPSQLHVSIPPLFTHHRSSFNTTSGSLIRWLIAHHPHWDVTSKIADFAASHACHIKIRSYHPHVNMEHAFRTCDVTPNAEED